MKSNLCNQIKRILADISVNLQFSAINNDQILLKNDHVVLLEIAEEQIISPVGDLIPLLKKQQFNYPDQPVNFDKLNHLLKLIGKNSLLRLNHFGVCYQTNDLDGEKSRLLGVLSPVKMHFYQELSLSKDVWLFLGDISRWEDPTLEFVLINETADPDKEYWLPHIQIDIDTTLSAEQTEKVISEVYGVNVKSFPIVINGTTYIMRKRLGRIDGVNIFLDLATNKRNVSFLKNSIWKQVKI